MPPATLPIPMGLPISPDTHAITIYSHSLKLLGKVGRNIQLKTGCTADIIFAGVEKRQLLKYLRRTTGPVPCGIG